MRRVWGPTRQLEDGWGCHGLPSQLHKNLLLAPFSIPLLSVSVTRSKVPFTPSLPELDRSNPQHWDLDQEQVRRSRLGSEFEGGAARPARRTLPHTHTGQRAPQFYNPQSKLLRFVNLGFDSFAVDVFNLDWTFLGFTQYRYFKLQKNQSTVVVPKSLPRLAKPEMSSLLNISICDAQTHSMSTQLNEAKLHFPVKKWVNGENWAKCTAASASAAGPQTEGKLSNTNHHHKTRCQILCSMRLHCFSKTDAS